MRWSLCRNGTHLIGIDGIEARQCNDTLAIVYLTHVARLRRDGSAIDVLDAVYVCTLKDGQWKLSTAIGCWPDWRERDAI